MELINYVRNPRQSVFDIALEVYGSLQGIYLIREDNNYPELCGQYTENTAIVKVRKLQVIDVRMQTYLKKYSPMGSNIEAT